MRKIDDRAMTEKKRKAILKKYDYTCMYCFGDADQVDHIVPWSYKHDDSDDNLVACCWLCNVVASNKMFKSFAKKQEYIQKWRYSWIKKNPIPLWTVSELRGYGYALKSSIERQAMVLDNNEQRQRVKRQLLDEGFRVIVGGEPRKITGKK